MSDAGVSVVAGERGVIGDGLNRVHHERDLGGFGVIPFRTAGALSDAGEGGASDEGEGNVEIGMQTIRRL